MKILIALVLAASCFAWKPKAEAAVFKLEFSLTGLINAGDQYPEVRRNARGSVTWEGMTATGAIDRLIAFDLRFAGAQFDLDDVGFRVIGSRLQIGGTVSGWGAVYGAAMRDDFFIQIDRALPRIESFFAALDGKNAGWADLAMWGYTGQKTVQFVDPNPADVSEPGTLMLALVGFATLAILHRRRPVFAPRVA